MFFCYFGVATWSGISFGVVLVLVVGVKDADVVGEEVADYYEVELWGEVGELAGHCWGLVLSACPCFFILRYVFYIYSIEMCRLAFRRIV